MGYPEAMERLLAELNGLPGVGPRTAERLAHHLLGVERAAALRLARALQDAHREVRLCERCFQYTDQAMCSVCRDAGRDARRVLVVAEPKDVALLEKAGWDGTYHVLLGRLDPVDPNDRGAGLTLEALCRRLESEPIDEVVLGLSADVAGDGTALWAAARLREARPGMRIFRLARGIPQGLALEYTNPGVLAEALRERRAVAPEAGTAGGAPP